MQDLVQWKSINEIRDVGDESKAAIQPFIFMGNISVVDWLEDSPISRRRRFWRCRVSLAELECLFYGNGGLGCAYKEVAMNVSFLSEGALTR